MKYLKNLSKSLLITLLTFFGLTFIFTLLNYFNIIGTKVMMVIKIIIPIISLIIGGFVLGKKATKNGWVEGLKLGLIITALILIGNLIIKANINIKDFIFYAILIISSMFGGMLGINTKKE